MTKSRLPEITLICGAGHPFTTSATAGQSVRCKTCGKSQRVPANRPVTEKEAAALVRAAPRAQAAEVAPVAIPDPRWASETPWDRELADRDPMPGDDDCPECSGPLEWSPRRTLTSCGTCYVIDLPPAIDMHYERQEQKSAETSIQDHPDTGAALHAQLELGAARLTAVDWIDERLETWGDENNYDDPQRAAEARQFGNVLRSCRDAARTAKSDADLNQIRREVTAFLASKDGAALRAEYLRSLERYKAAEAREREVAEQKQRAEGERAQWEAEEQRRIAAQRDNAAELQRTQRLAIEQGKPKVVPGFVIKPTIAPVLPDNYALAAITDAVTKWTDRRDAKAEKIKRNGKCGAGGCKNAASRHYGFFNQGEIVSDYVSYLVCDKHFAMADTAMKQEKTKKGWDVPHYYKELDQT